MCFKIGSHPPTLSFLRKDVGSTCTRNFKNGEKSAPRGGAQPWGGAIPVGRKAGNQSSGNAHPILGRGAPCTSLIVSTLTAGRRPNAAPSTSPAPPPPRAMLRWASVGGSVREACPSRMPPARHGRGGRSWQKYIYFQKFGPRHRKRELSLFSSYWKFGCFRIIEISHSF